MILLVVYRIPIRFPHCTLRCTRIVCIIMMIIMYCRRVISGTTLSEPKWTYTEHTLHTWKNKNGMEKGETNMRGESQMEWLARNFIAHHKKTRRRKRYSHYIYVCVCGIVRLITIENRWFYGAWKITRGIMGYERKENMEHATKTTQSWRRRDFIAIIFQTKKLQHNVSCFESNFYHDGNDCIEQNART